MERLTLLTLLLAIVTTTAAFEFQYPANDTLRCGGRRNGKFALEAGLILDGLEELSGDYLGSTDSYYKSVTHGILQLAFTWTDPDHPQHTPYGCDLLDCPAEERSEARGKWGIIATTDGGMQNRLLAICDRGCPDWKPSCADIYNEPPTEPDPLHCPVWPAEWKQAMHWRIINTTDGNTTVRSLTASASCCHRKAQLCDSCGYDKCSGLAGLLHNNCPPSKGSFFHPQSDYQRSCCQTYRPPPLEQPTCGCVDPVSECDHT